MVVALQPPFLRKDFVNYENHHHIPSSTHASVTSKVICGVLANAVII